jgi:hypothetical protein
MDQFRKYLVPTEKSELDFPFIPREGIIHVNKRQSFGGINVRLSRLEF